MIYLQVLTVMATLLTDFDINDLLKIVIVLIMFSVGLSLKLSDFQYIIKNQRLIFIGLFLKMVLLPIFGFLILEWLPLALEWKLGTMIVLVCPGGTTSNVITYWFNGTPALTIFLTTISGVIAIFLIPLLVNHFSVHYFGSGTSFYLSFWETIGSIFFLIITPSLIGLAYRKWKPVMAVKIEQILKPVSVTLLGLVFVLKLFFDDSNTNTGVSFQEITLLFPILLTINVGGILWGYFLPALFQVVPKDRLTIGVEMGVHNIGLALLVGGVLLGNTELIKPALIYVFFTFWTTALFAFVVNRYVLKKEIKTV